MSHMNDEHGCSLCEDVEERYERFYSKVARGYRVQYDYRTRDGRLFSCVARNLKEARARRDAWLEAEVKKAEAAKAEESETA